MGGERTDGNHIYGCVLHNCSAGGEQRREEVARKEKRGASWAADPARFTWQSVRLPFRATMLTITSHPSGH